jgi:3-isopropylmalate/(R)-2-methylmalate dehydratase large subunit
MGKTMIEKILARASGRKEVSVGEIVFAKPHMVLSHDNSAAILKIFEKMGGTKVWDPERVFIALDHEVPPPDSKKADNHKAIRNFVAEKGIKYFYDCGVGICHQVLPEYGHVIPGVVILGSDSHTTTHGALAAAGIAIGRTETASVWALGETWLRVPDSIKIVLEGALGKNVDAKDVILYIIGQLTAEGANYKSIEFHGGAIKTIGVGGRMTLCNMSAEAGCKCAMVPADEITEAYLKEVGAPKYRALNPDRDARYGAVYSYDVSMIPPMVAKPHKVDNVSPVSEVEDVKIDVALLGTCTNGRIEDLETAARIIDGKKIAKGVRLLVYPASRRVLDQAYERGVARTLLNAGAQIAVPACGPCLGAYGGVLATGERAISTANRNFKGRMGTKEGTEIYLASPATVAASAVAGKIVSP